MREYYSIKELRDLTWGVEEFPSEVLDWISKEGLWNLWVPKAYGGLELSFLAGLTKLKDLARIDGSLGWTVTLCSGANYFIGNLKEEVVQQIFKPDNPVCFGGSGAVCGMAEKQGDQFFISGTWPYATGAPYLSHFTLNTRVTENHKTIRNKDGSPLIQSFLIPLKDVQIIEDWDAMGLKGTASHSFKVKEAIVRESHSFHYNQIYLPQTIFKINFSVFAALTLWVNYIGIAEHFLEEAEKLQLNNKLNSLGKSICVSNDKVKKNAEATENIIHTKSNFSKQFIENLYQEAKDSVSNLSREIIRIYPFLGIRACSNDNQLNQIFRDYFTATQHHIFTRNKN